LCYLLFLNTYYLKFRGIDAKFDKPVQLLNASVPDGVGILFQSSGAVPVSEFIVELILYTLLKIVTLVLNVNCNTFVIERQFLNVPEKFTTFILVSNNVDGTDVSAVQPKKHDANVVADITLSNNPDGTFVRVGIDENVSVNVVALGEKSNISAGIAVILVPLIKFAKDVTSFNPVYPPTKSKSSLPGMDVKLTHPKKFIERNPTIPH
jgi:hypothetical protein